MGWFRSNQIRFDLICSDRSGEGGGNEGYGEDADVDDVDDDEGNL